MGTAIKHPVPYGNSRRQRVNCVLMYWLLCCPAEGATLCLLCTATVTCVSLTGDGQCVLVSTLNSCLYLIDKSTGELLNE